MERPDIGFSIYVQISSVVQIEKIVKGGITKNKYDGQITQFTEFNRSPLLIDKKK